MSSLPTEAYSYPQPTDVSEGANEKKDQKLDL